MNALIRKNFFFNFFNTFANLCFPLITLPYITRVLGPEYYGRVSFAISLSMVFMFFGGNGIQVYALREISKVYKRSKQFKQICTELLLTFFVLSVIATLCYLLIVRLIAHGPEDFWFLAIFAIQILFNFLSLEWLFKTMNLNDKIAMRNLVIKTITIVSIFLFIKTRQDFILYSLILNISFVFAYLVYGLSSRKYFSNQLRSLHVKKHVGIMGFTFCIGLITLFYKECDKLIVGFFLGNASLGYYNVAQRVIVIQSMLLLTLPGVLYTIIIDSYQHNKKYFKQLINNLLNFTVYFALLIVILDIALAPQIILLLFGDQYALSIPTLRILAANLPVSALSTILGLNVLYSLGAERKYFSAVLRVFLVCLVSFLILIPRFGFNGAALGVFIAESVGLIYLSIVTRSYTVGVFPLQQTLKLLFLTTVTAGVSYVLVHVLQHMVHGLLFIICVGTLISSTYFLVSILIGYDVTFIRYFIYAKFKLLSVTRGAYIYDKYESV